jgi:hypothetical protein
MQLKYLAIHFHLNLSQNSYYIAEYYLNPDSKSYNSSQNSNSLLRTFYSNLSLLLAKMESTRIMHLISLYYSTL